MAEQTTKSTEEKPVAKPEEELEDETEDKDTVLEEIRESVPLNTENSEFFPSPAGLVSMRLRHPDGTVEEFERVIPIRCFPVTNPDEFICIRDGNPEWRGKGQEIGMLRRITDIDENSRNVLSAELERRYFTPTILKILNIKDSFGYSYWDVETTAGSLNFVLNNPFSNIRVLEDGSVFINDMDGNCFKIPNPKALDAASFHRIEVYL